jgi:hypothetical protein
MIVFIMSTTEITLAIILTSCLIALFRLRSKCSSLGRQNKCLGIDLDASQEGGEIQKSKGDEARAALTRTLEEVETLEGIQKMKEADLAKAEDRIEKLSSELASQQKLSQELTARSDNQAKRLVLIQEFIVDQATQTV